MRVAFALPLEAEDRLAPDAQRHGHEVVARCSTAHELAARLELLAPDAVVVAATPTHLTPPLVEACDAGGVRLLALAPDDAGRRFAADLGVLDPADLACRWPEVEQALERLATGPTQHPRREGGRVIAVWGPSGAPGRTSVAITLAAELAAAGYSVALGDVDTHSASVAPALGMLDEAPGFAAACRLAGSDSLTQSELERIAQRYISGHGSFWVLTGLGRPRRWPELSASRVSGAIAECRRWVDFTVLDTAASLESDEEISSDLFAPRRNAATLTALADADQVIAVGAADPIGMSRLLRAHVDLTETVAAGRTLVVANKVRASAIGLNPVGQVTQALSRFGNIRPSALVPWDPEALDAALLLGRTLADAAPRSAARAAVRELVETVIAPVEHPTRSPRSARVLRRLPGRRAIATPGTG